MRYIAKTPPAKISIAAQPPSCGSLGRPKKARRSLAAALLSTPEHAQRDDTPPSVHDESAGLVGAEVHWAKERPRGRRQPGRQGAPAAMRALQGLDETGSLLIALVVWLVRHAP